MSNQQYPYNQQPQQPYGGQQPGQPYGGQPYGGQHPGQPYGQQPYSAQGMYGATPQKKSPILGYIGLGLVVVCAIAVIVAAATLGGAFGELMSSLGLDQNFDEELLAQDPRFLEFVASTSTLWTVVQGGASLGFVGWIISIVAVATKRGRGAGIWGIILGIVAPIIAMVVGVSTMWPAIAAMIQ